MTSQRLAISKSLVAELASEPLFLISFHHLINKRNPMTQQRETHIREEKTNKEEK
ncbi:hypothetical protein LguiA_001737 [Lonicera macranthoides]